MKLTIIIPTKDRPNLLKRSVASALKALPSEQDQCLVVNDGVLATTVEALKCFADDRLKVVDNLGANGPASARNFGMRCSDSDLFLFLDDDDELLENYPTQILEIHKNSTAGYGFCKYVEFFDFSNKVGNKEIARGRAYSEGFIPNCLNFKHCIAGFGMGFWISKATYDLVGPLDETLLTSEDVEYQIRLFRNGVPGWYHQNSGIRVYRHKGSLLMDRAHQTEIIGLFEKSNDLASIMEIHSDFLLIKTNIYKYLIKRYVKLAARSGNYRGLLYYLMKYCSGIIFGK